MFRPPGHGGEVGPSSPVGKELDFFGPEPAVAVGAEGRLVAPGAGVRVVESQYGVDLPEVRAVASGFVIRPAVRDVEVRIDPTAEMAVLAERRSEEHTSELQSPTNLVCRL